MATARNPITGQLIKTKHNTSEYQAGYDRIFGNKNKQPDQPTEDVQPEITSKEQQQ